MITVHTTNEDTGVRITILGHSTEDCGEEEKYQVCAAVSALTVTLATVTMGVWDGENSGHVSCYVPDEHLRLAEFVLVGLQLLAGSYPEHINVIRTDSRLFRSQETARWNRITLPAPAMTAPEVEDPPSDP